MRGWEAFRQDCRKGLVERLTIARGADEVAAAVQQLQRRCEDFLARQLADGSGRHIACGPGCGTCCAVNVAVLLPEAIAITRHLRDNFSPQARDELATRFDDLRRSVRWLDDDERIFLRRSCAFLDADGSCLIWPVRPLLCRSITSTDAEACREALAAPIFGEERPILMNLVQKELFEEAFHALGEALERLGWDRRSFKLTCAVPPLLRQPRLLEEFLRGEVLPVP